VDSTLKGCDFESESLDKVGFDSDGELIGRAIFEGMPLKSGRTYAVVVLCNCIIA